MKFQEPSQSEWDQMRPPMEVKAVRGIGWILFAAGVAVLTVFGAYEFTVDPAVESIEKITVLAVVLGGAFLFVTVLYERIRSAKSDKYREIEK